MVLLDFDWVCKPLPPLSIDAESFFLLLDTYVILITGRESVGHLASHEIWRLTKFEIIPLRLGKGNAIRVMNPENRGSWSLILCEGYR